MSSLSALIEQFILEHVDSIEEIEILVHLHRHHPDKTWSAASLALELRINLLSASDRLDKLERKGIVERTGSAAFRYAPREDSLATAIAALSQVYPTHQTTIITLILSKPNDKVQSFPEKK